MPADSRGQGLCDCFRALCARIGCRARVRAVVWFAPLLFVAYLSGSARFAPFSRVRGLCSWGAGMVSSRSVFLLPAAAFVSHAFASEHGNGSRIAVLYQNGSADVDSAFRQVFGHFASGFDYDLYGRALADFEAGFERHKGSAVFSGHALGAVAPHCDKGVAPSAVANVRGVAAFPGGTVGSVFGFDLGKRLFELSGHAQGPASAGLVAPFALSTQALSTGMGLVQAAVAAMVHVVPPLVPPPAWNNQPLSCVPMVSGHNCFGSVLYPITMADFMLADVTDSMLDGYVASFPGLYAKKVGKTSDAMYKSCFAAYMGMMCASVFPRCTTPQSRDEIIPVGGSVPVCLHMCVLPLVMCPGFWVSDLLDSCSSVSVPPLCSQAKFANVKRAPPQIASFDEASPFAPECPPTVAVRDGDLALYDAKGFPDSPIEKEAAAYAPSPAMAPQDV